MANSMTAYSQQQALTASGEIVWELKSLNHRHLNINYFLPDYFEFLEPEISAIVKRYIKRGKIDIKLSMNNHAATKSSSNINQSLLNQLLTHIQNISLLSQQHGQNITLNIMDLVKWPGVIVQDQVSTNLQQFIITQLEVAIQKLVEYRTCEGIQLQKILTVKLNQIQQHVNHIRKRMPLLINSLKEKINNRVKELTITLESSSLEQEICFLIQKHDITEELDRLEIHISEFKKIIPESDLIGRKLEFILQEMLRETNTIASKTTDLETTQAAIDIKVLIEQAREQVQNIE